MSLLLCLAYFSSIIETGKVCRTLEKKIKPLGNIDSLNKS
jgi:hypothetical protein